GHAQHHRGVALARLTVGGEAVAPAEREEELARPAVAERELHLDRGRLPPHLGEPPGDPLDRRRRGEALALGAGAGEERLDLSQPSAELALVAIAHCFSMKASSTFFSPSCSKAMVSLLSSTWRTVP